MLKKNFMKISSLGIPDVLLIEPYVIQDSRGLFFESYNQKILQKKTLSKISFVQEAQSKSFKGVLRGLHYQIQHPQGKLVRCLFGRIYDVVVDLRKNSPTFGQWVGIDLYPGSPQLWVPPGFAHGFRTLTEKVEVLYKVTDYQYKEYERTLMWNDLPINWGNEFEPIMSEKDMRGISFEECEKYE